MFLASQMIILVGAKIAHHDNTLCRGLQIYRKENLKCNKDKYHFKYIPVPFFSEIISEKGVENRSEKAEDTSWHATIKREKYLQALFAVLNF